MGTELDVLIVGNLGDQNWSLKLEAGMSSTLIEQARLMFSRKVTLKNSRRTGNPAQLLAHTVAAAALDPVVSKFRPKLFLGCSPSTGP
jgi:hypothetical protein